MLCDLTFLSYGMSDGVERGRYCEAVGRAAGELEAADRARNVSTHLRIIL